MLKYSIAFAAGMLATAVIAYEGHAGAGAWFLAGILFMIVIEAGLLASTRRAARFARFLNAFVHAWNRKPAADRNAPEPAEITPAAANVRSFDRQLDTFYEKPKAAGVSPLESEIASALRNMGARKPDAAAAAHQVVTDGAEDFETGFRHAVSLVRKAAA